MCRCLVRHLWCAVVLRRDHRFGLVAETVAKICATAALECWGALCSACAGRENEEEARAATATGASCLYCLVGRALSRLGDRSTAPPSRYQWTFKIERRCYLYWPPFFVLFDCIKQNPSPVIFEPRWVQPCGLGSPRIAAALRGTQWTSQSASEQQSWAAARTLRTLNGCGPPAAAGSGRMSGSR
jgi:hypothetical protein